MSHVSPGEPLLVPGAGGEQQPVQLEAKALLGVPLGQLLPLHARRALVTEYLTGIRLGNFVDK